VGSEGRIWDGERVEGVDRGNTARSCQSCASRAGAGPHAHVRAAGVAPVPTLELRPGVSDRRRERRSPGVAASIRARARAGDAASPKQEEGEGGSRARSSCDVRGGGARLDKEAFGVGAAGAEMPWWGKRCGRNERVWK
jgi:hypothetical protein